MISKDFNLDILGRKVEVIDVLMRALKDLFVCKSDRKHLIETYIRQFIIGIIILFL